MDQMETFKRMREAEAKSDLIGIIHNSEIYELLGFHRVTTTGEKESWDNFNKNLVDVAGNEAEKVGDLAVAYGNEREETGFRLGFHMAMRLCMEGMAKGIY